MNLSLRQLKAFLAVARLKSFTRAAEQQHMTQQGLSLMIREMERQLGSRLFDRTTRSLTLAPAGRQLLGTAEEVVRRLEDTAASIEQMSRQSSRTLAVADFGLGVFFKPIAGIQRRRIFDCELLYLHNKPTTSKHIRWADLSEQTVLQYPCKSIHI